MDGDVQSIGPRPGRGLVHRRAHLELRGLHDEAGAAAGRGQQEGSLHSGPAAQAGGARAQVLVSVDGSQLT